MKRLLGFVLAILTVVASMAVVPAPASALSVDVEATCQRVDGNWCLKYTYYGEIQDEGTDVKTYAVAGGQCQVMPDGTYKKYVQYVGHDWRIYAVYGHWEHLILGTTMETYEGSSGKVYYGSEYSMGYAWVPC